MNRKITNSYINIFSVLFRLFCLTAGVLFASVVSSATAHTAIVLSLDGVIGPATQEYVVDGLATAAKQKAAVVVLQIDTPGGLDRSMRAIIQAILASPIPVVSYVAPSGARAASAGTYILYASQLAAMAPGTNLGAATPVELNGGSESQQTSNQTTMQHKMQNDAAAYIKSLAELRGRNAVWAQQAVTSSVSISASEALKIHVINNIANNIPDLLSAINGRAVSVAGQNQILQTNQLHIITLAPNWRIELLTIITDPSIAYILLILGIYALFFEFAHPGFILPGVFGAIAIVFALYALNMLPINYAGLGLIILGFIFLIAEIFVPSFGALGFGGIIAFVFGSLFLMHTDNALFQIDISLIIFMAVITGLFFLGIIGMAIRARQRKIVSGQEALMNMIGIALEDFEESGWVLVNGERWQAISQQPIKQNQKIRVKAVKGLKLIIEVI